jgi:hypothetical protein
MATSEQDGALVTASDGVIPPGWYQIGHNPNRQTYWTGAAWSGKRQWSAGAGWQETSDATTDGSKRRRRRDQSKVRKVWGAGVLAVFLLAGAALGVVALNAHSSKSSHADKGATSAPTALVAPSTASSTTTPPAPVTTPHIP